jgi:hypothetical protein
VTFPNDHFRPVSEDCPIAICDRSVAVQNSQMSWLKNDDNPQTLEAAHWSVQPTWVKLYTICIGLPAWIFLMFGIFAADFGDLAMNVAIALFAAAAVMQMFFVFRGYWRMDI